jgi:hypothetical protein
MLYELEDVEIDKVFIPNKFSTSSLLSKIPDYDYVIGIADHSKNAKRSRFDPKYINKYSKKIISQSDEYRLSNLDIDLPSNFYRYDGVTNGPCNRSAFLVMDKIVKDKLNTKFGFFHLQKASCAEDLDLILSLL